MALDLGTFEHLVAQGVRYRPQPKDSRAIQKSFRIRHRPGFLVTTLYSLVLMTLTVCADLLHESFPDWFTESFFVGLLSSAAALIALSFSVNAFRLRRAARDTRFSPERIIGVDGELLWLAVEHQSFRFFLASSAFKSIRFRGDYLFAQIVTGEFIIIKQSLLMQSERGKAVHAWLSRAKAEIDFGTKDVRQGP